MLKSKKLVSILMVLLSFLLVTNSGVYATITSTSEDKSQSSQIVSEEENARYFAEVNGEYKEVTKEEYEKRPKKYFATVDGEFKQIDKEEFYSLVRESDKKEKEFLSKKEKQRVDNTYSNLSSSGQITPMALMQLAKWNFTNKPYNSIIDTSLFNYSAGNSNKKITLNLRQWRSSGSTNESYATYCIRGRDSAGNLIYYGDDQYVQGYYPNNSSYPAAKLYFTMPYNNINNVFVRVVITDSYNVSGFGEAYNY